MASHNGEQYIKAQIESILAQLSPDDELIISDDGSTDRTIEIIRTYNDSRIKYIHFQHCNNFSNRRLSSYYYATANFFNALEHALGDFIFLSDQDDIWMPTKVKDCLQILKQNDIVCHNFSIINKDGEIEVDKYDNKVKYDKLNMIQYLRILPFRGCCLAFRRNVLKLARPYPRHVFLHDCYIGLVAVVNHQRFAYLDKPLILYRRHEQNVSSLDAGNPFWFKCWYRLKLLIQACMHQKYKN